MKVIDLVYQVVKSTYLLDYEISKEDFKNGNYYSNSDLAVASFNIYNVLNDAISLAYTLDKVAPVRKNMQKNITNIYQVDDEMEDILSVYQYREKANGAYLGFQTFEHSMGEENGTIIVHDIVPSTFRSLVFQYIKRLPLLDETYNDIELEEYGITNTIALNCAKYAIATLKQNYDENIAHLGKNEALSFINALPEYGNKRIMIQTEIYAKYGY